MNTNFQVVSGTHVIEAIFVDKMYNFDVYSVLSLRDKGKQELSTTFF